MRNRAQKITAAAGLRRTLLMVVTVFAVVTPASMAAFHTNNYCQGCVVTSYKMDGGATGGAVESYAHYIGSGVRKTCANTRTASAQVATGSVCDNWGTNQAFQQSGLSNVFAATQNNTGGSQITENAHGNYL